jgi:hypothetical protein
LLKSNIFANCISPDIPNFPERDLHVVNVLIPAPRNRLDSREVGFVLNVVFDTWCDASCPAGDPRIPIRTAKSAAQVSYNHK